MKHDLKKWNNTRLYFLAAEIREIDFRGAQLAQVSLGKRSIRDILLFISNKRGLLMCLNAYCKPIGI
jgi:hypothetical protein